MLYKLYQQLFRRSTSRAGIIDINECQFADDVALLATSHAGAEEAIGAYHSTATVFGPTVSYSKTKFLVAGHGIYSRGRYASNNDTWRKCRMCICVCILGFPDGQLDVEVEKHIAGASRAFGALRHVAFHDGALSLTTKRLMHQVHVLSVLL